MSSSAAANSDPLLRTLAPALRQLQRHLREWLDAPHRFPRSTIVNATLEGLATDLERSAQALDVDRPLLVIMLMGGTGVGKSTLLNALAGGGIAQASFARPTTRDPVVYYHESIKVDRLDPALQHCRLASHDRPALEHKVLVDTPDLDSNDLSNRDKLMQILPVADIVLYVGSQEKYHDKLGWDLFKHQRKRRAFAFILNKWDRCSVHTATGVRPDDDLLKDLKDEGFQNPLLFRTCAQLWVDKASGDGAVEPPEGEQFPDLIRWLEMGLTRMEIEAVKARGVGQLLRQLQDTLQKACPPDLNETAKKTRSAWDRILADEADASGEILLNTLEPYQKEIEHHFTVEGQRRFRGLMAGYLNMFNKVKYMGSRLRDRFSILPSLPRPSAEVETPTTWDLAAFTSSCTSVAGERHLDARSKALANRLLLEADQHDFPLDLLTEPTESASKIDWRQRYSHALIESLTFVEQQWSKPTGLRRLIQGGIVLAGNWLPPIALLAALMQLLWNYFVNQYLPQWLDIFLPFIITLIVVILLHVVVVLVLPLRWPKIRGEFLARLDKQLRAELEKVYSVIPGEVAESLIGERRQVEKLQFEAREVANWLEQQQQKAAGVLDLYGK